MPRELLGEFRPSEELWAIDPGPMVILSAPDKDIPVSVFEIKKFEIRAAETDESSFIPSALLPSAVKLSIHKNFEPSPPERFKALSDVVPTESFRKCPLFSV